MSLLTSRRGIPAVALVVMGVVAASAAFADREKTVRVNCTRGDTVARALEKGDERKPLVVLLSGICSESVTIDRSDVTLRGDGGVLQGPDPAVDVLTVTADRVAVENLVINGGRNGIFTSGAGALSIRGTTVESTGRTGITLAGSSGAVIDGTTVRLNPRDGITLDGSQATIINSNVSQNGRVGIFVGIAAAARIGVDNANNAAGSTISQNGATGVNIILGGSALIANNTITLNGTDPASNSGRAGINVIQASADIAAGNTIADNAGQGIFVRSASVQVGNPGFALPPVNTISGNGNATSPGGIFATVGSALVIRDARIIANRGFGLGIFLRSHAQLSGSQIHDTVALPPTQGQPPNPGDGIRLAFGGALQALTPISTLVGNQGPALSCIDGESSVINIGALGLAVLPPGCTGFENAL
jgi:parallel beta-helix repeat protein